jgi:DNA-binding transcriptional LysR family regulator
MRWRQARIVGDVIKPSGKSSTFNERLKIMGGLDLGDLSLFLRVLDRGSISAAARQLDLSVAVASKRLKRLEQRLGVRLLHRTTRQLQPTPEGLMLAAQGRLQIEELELVTSSLGSNARSIAGTLRVTIPASFGRQYISPLLPQFMSKHPRLRLHIDLSDRLKDLVAEGFDLAIRIGALRDSELTAMRLAPNRRVLCASPAYLRKHGVPTKPEDLAEHECLLLAVGRDASDVWRLIAKDGATIDVRVRSRVRSNFGEVIHDAALAGMGIALHSTWHVSDDLRAGRLKRVLPDYELPESGIYALMPQRRMVLPRVRAFVDFLKQRFGETPSWERAMAVTPESAASKRSISRAAG